MKRSPGLSVTIDRKAGPPVFEQICAAIRARAMAGALPEGTWLPPTRALATELGVSRSTVITAYEQLVAEGYLEGRRGAGHVIRALGGVDLAARPEPAAARNPDQPPPPRPFAAGQPDMRLFPYRQWARTVSRLCRTAPHSMLAGGPVFGDPDLRREIAAHVAQWRGVETSPHQIVVTAGATDALELCMRALGAPGDLVGLETPGYLPLRHFVQSHGLIPSYLEVDENGATLPRHASPRFVILTPSHQFPLGGAMSPDRRMAFIRWANAQGSWILEDDYDSEFRYAGRPIPAMAGFDRLSRTLYIGSFSKIFSSSLRLGYVILPEALLDRFARTMAQTGIRASTMPQPALAAFMASGEFYRHLRRVRRIHDERRRFLLDSLTRDFADYGHFTDHQAGMQVVLHLDPRFRDTELARRAAQKGLAVQPLSGFCAEGVPGNGLVLGFCGVTPAEMAPALTVLRECFAPC